MKTGRGSLRNLFILKCDTGDLKILLSNTWLAFISFTLDKQKMWIEHGRFLMGEWGMCWDVKRWRGISQLKIATILRHCKPFIYFIYTVILWEKRHFSFQNNLLYNSITRWESVGGWNYPQLNSISSMKMDTVPFAICLYTMWPWQPGHPVYRPWS